MDKKKYLTSGLFFGLAGVTGLYSLVPALVVFVVLLIKNRKSFIKFLAGFSLIFVLVNLIFILWDGLVYIHSVYLWHLFKPKIKGIIGNMFIEYFVKNIFLVLAALLFLFVKDKKKLSLAGLISIFYLIFLVLIRSFNFYFVLLAPFLAILGGYSVVNVMKRFKKKLVTVILLIVSMLFFLFAINNVIYLENFDFVDFQSKDTLINHIKENSNANDKIFGDVTFTPLAALLADRSIAFNEVDTNAQRILSGSLNVDKVIEKLKKEKVKFVIVRPALGIGNHPKFGEFIKENCKYSLWIKDKYFGDIFIYDCLG